MANTPTAKEVSIDLAGFKSSVDQQFTSLKGALAQAEIAIDKRLDFVAKLVFAMFAIFPISIAGGFFLRNEISDVKIELGKIGVQISGLREDLSRIEKRGDKPPVSVSDPQIIALQTQMNFVLHRIEDRLNNSSVPPAIALTEDEKQLIRNYLGVKPSKEAAKYSVGDVVSGAIDLPDALVSKLPKLQGLRYLKDPNNGSALLVARDNRIVAIIEPA
jgi:hypothetical protein